MENLFNNKNSFEVSKEFYSDKNNAPFTHCNLCNKELIESDSEYMIEKAFSKSLITGKTEVVFELAYCFDCMDGVKSEISKESMNNLINFFMTKSNIEKRNSELIKYELFETPIWINNCIIENVNIEDASEYQIASLCKGNKMFFNHTPYMISGEALEKITELLSKETLNILNGVRDKLIDLPDEVKNTTRTRPVFF